MQYREFTRDRLKISQLGFGCMRFPVIGGDNSAIDEEKATAMLRVAYDRGVNYFDTAYRYHDGKSEPFVGKVLEEIGRKDLFLATKLPVWLCKSQADCRNIFEEQLELLRTDYVDFYLCHALYKKQFEQINSYDAYAFLDEEKRKGRIRYAGFSFHDELSVFKDIIDRYDWDFCQIQLNYMDTEFQAGLEGLHYAKSKGIDVVIMEPIKGGKLAKNPPELREIFAASGRNYTPAEWAQRWVYDLEDVSVMLSGMSTIDQVLENLDIADVAKANSMTEADLETLRKAREFYTDRTPVDCTACEYCLPCPSGVQIPKVFSLYNNAAIYDDRASQKKEYAALVAKDRSGRSCVECGQCEEACPQHLPVIDDLKRADEYFFK